jgi:peptidoglycan DL-endopeptidase CwlS
MNASLRTRVVSGIVVGAVALASCSLGGTAKKKSTVTSSASTNFPTIAIPATVSTAPTTAPPAGGAGLTQTTTDAPGTYTVKLGDAWYVIAKRVGVDVQSLLDAQDPPATLKTQLFPGMKLVLPDATSTPPPSDTSASGSGSGSTASPTTTSNIKVVGTYTVKAKDYWIGIAKALGVQLNDLLAVNNATTDTRLDPGKVIKVPAKRKA